MKSDKKNEIHTALYRKYRPQEFTAVIGQDHIVKAISGAISSGKVAHAYLLCGPRGTGKTTIARIIARELGTSPSDIYELDAASNRRIEDVRDIRDGLTTLPFDSKYKVYILDEVHMLTKEAWNALLKSIEEPPAHVIFILATTELEKVPETIVSRCQSFIFRKPTDAILSAVVTNVAKEEGYSIEDGGAELVALLGDGSFRDTLSTLDKVISFTKGKKITKEDISLVSGAPEATLVEDFLIALKENTIEKGYTAIRTAHMQNVDMQVFIKLVLSQLRYALMLRYAPNTQKEIAGRVSAHDMEFLTALIEGKPEHISSRTLSVLLDAYQKQRYAFISELPLELALVEILENK